MHCYTCTRALSSFLSLEKWERDWYLSHVSDVRIERVQLFVGALGAKELRYVSGNLRVDSNVLCIVDIRQVGKYED